MIAVYYNPKRDTYYAKLLKVSYLNDYYKVGYVNQFGHKLVCMFYINNKRLQPCKSFLDYMHNKKSIKKRLINKIIKFLERRV